MFDSIVASAAAARSAGDRVRAYARLENSACATRLSAMADLLADAQAADGSAEREQWRCDNWAAVCASIGAAAELTSGVASGLLMDAVTLRERLPKVAAVFADGLISYRLVHAICQRTMLVRDPDALAAIDAELAELLRGWGAKSVYQSERDIDTLVLRHDPHAVRRTESAVRSTHVDVRVEDATGVGYLEAKLTVTDAHAVDLRVEALARTVCERDPRTRDQRRAAALGAMGFGWDRLPCLCEQPDCAAASKPPVGGVVVHVITRAHSADTAASDGPPAPTQPPTTPTPTPDAEPEADAEAEGDSDAQVELATSAPAAEVADAAAALAQRRALLGEPPPLLPKPWYSYTFSGLSTALNAEVGQCPAAPPAVILGGPVLPGALVDLAAQHATITALIHPGHAPPEPRYRPSKKLAEFVRCRDQTCRFPGCTKPATVADLDHTIPWPFGPTCASNLKCLCREHHLLKTFWPGWRDEQHADGTVVWTDPYGHTVTTHPGSRLLFPELCTPTAELTVTGSLPAKHTAGLTMPRRKTTRTEDRRRRVTAERRANETVQAELDSVTPQTAETPSRLEDPPPF